MTTLREWFDHFTEATGEVPQHIVFGFVWDDDADRWPAIVVDEVLAFADVPAKALDARFDDSYGGTEAPNFAAWSENFVLFCDQYDGAESICWVPRHPMAHTPLRPGGG